MSKKNCYTVSFWHLSFDELIFLCANIVVITLINTAPFKRILNDKEKMI